MIYRFNDSDKAYKFLEFVKSLELAHENVKDFTSTIMRFNYAIVDNPSKISEDKVNTFYDELRGT
jgi:hypothetical protein